MTMSTRTGRNYDELIEEHRVHRSIYVDPGIFEEEMTKIFGGTWVYLGHESEIPEPFDFKRTTLGLRPIILTRSGEGEVQALFNRCAHRASTVCNEERGRARTFQCPYHGWTYSSSGALVGIPFREGYPAEVLKAHRGLARVPRVDSYAGFVFGTLNAEAPKLLDYLGPRTVELLDEFVSRSPTGEVEIRNRHQMLYRGNWKLSWDNAADGLHPTFVHRSFVMLNAKLHGDDRSLSAFKSNPDDTPMFSEDLGNGHMFVDQRPGLRTSFWDTQRPVPGTEALERQIREKYGDRAEEYLEMAPGSFMNLSIFPNVLIVGNQLQIVEPLSVDRTRLSFYVAASKGAPEEVNVLRMRIAEDFPALGNSDDLEIYERCHDGLMVPEMEWVDTSKGYGTDYDQPDERGIRRSPVTYDIAMRNYLREYKRLMGSDIETTVEYA